jgi:hypothetical protein
VHLKFQKFSGVNAPEPPRAEGKEKGGIMKSKNTLKNALLVYAYA